MKFTKIPQDTFNELQLNAGILVKDFDVSTGTFVDSDMITATTGGITVSVKPTFEDFGDDIDNCPKNTMELKKKTDADEVTISTTALCINENMLIFMLGAADKDSVTGAIKPRKDLKTTDFSTIWWIGDLANGGYIAVKIMNALSTDGFEIKTSDKGKGNISLTLTGHTSIYAQDVIPAEFYLGAPEDEGLYITLDRSRATVEENKTLALTATATSGATVAFSSSNTSVATVNASTGVVAGVDAGQCVIIATATDDGATETATCIVTVTAAANGEG